RGRVGRSARRGYCYAFFQKGKQLTEVQERRLRAIREFTDLGAGFKIAMKDLEIRGAGNLLGTAQSGFMESIGYDMFLRILDETLRKRKGEHTEERVDTRIELKLSAYISDEYVGDSQTRIDMYKQISALEGSGEELLQTFEDKYGAAPVALRNLLRIAEIKYYCEMMGIVLVRETANQVFLKFAEDHKMDFFKMGAMLNECKFVTYVTGTSEELRMEKPEDANWIEDIARKIETVYNYLM
ncbi:MAG: transcription-repair coupling factor, partial [Bacillota bacterium]|nr:transcription-repair coupling factor [Bacillota bacterium]